MRLRALLAGSTASRPRPPGPARASRARPIEYGMLLTATFCLLATGAVMVYSASSARDLLSGQGDGTDKLVRYVIYGSIGLLLMRALSRHGLAGARRITPGLLLAAFALLFAVLVPGIGVTVNGARRWVGAGPLQFQPSELMKLAVVLYAAHVLTRRSRDMTSIRRGHAPVLVVAGLACLLVAAQPDLGTALVILATVTCVLVVAGVPLRKLALLAGGVAGLVLIFALLEPYRRARLTTFLDPWSHAGTSGFQSVQGQIALGSGGLFGVGLGQSVQKVFYLPEAHTDFILAVLGEELGVAGIAVVLSLYGTIAYAGLRVARAARDPWSMLVAAGLTSLIVSQATLNIFTVLGLAPLTGVPLPFISYGSSSLLVLLAGMGLLLNIAAGGSLTARGSVPARRGQESEAKRGGADAPSAARAGDRDRRRRNRRPRGTGVGGSRRAAS